MFLHLALWLTPLAEAARVKDVASIFGVRDNPIMGYGLVTGLNRTGDSAQNAATVRDLVNRLQGLGITMSADDIKSRNVAVVMVTATLPAGSRPGSHLDVSVSSAGDARSIEGGILLLTPLFAANGMNVATAQGALTVGGYAVHAEGDASIKNHPTVGRVPRGATVEVELPNAVNFSQQGDFEWVLMQPDFTNASTLARVFDQDLKGEFARVIDSGTVRLSVPDAWLGRQVEMIARLESLQLPLDHVNKVVVNERTGTVVMGAEITLSPMAVAHGGLTIEVREQRGVSQPNLLGRGETTVVDNRDIEVREQSGKVALLKGVTVGDVVQALNELGVSPRDLIVILQAMRAAGGLQAEIETI
jgi:flagellar P-ring protein precursor FlgI